MPRITVEEISQKEFSFANKGYNQKEVDDFLDDICDEIERMESEIMDLRQKTTVVRPAAQEESGVSAENEESFREVLALAVQVKEETLRKAREDAEAIRVKAETEASPRITARSLRRFCRRSRKRWTKPRGCSEEAENHVWTPAGRKKTQRHGSHHPDHSVPDAHAVRRAGIPAAETGL